MFQAKNLTVEKKFIIFLFLYCLLHLILRVAVSDVLENDEAEMLFYFQQPLALGYNSQPPLYTWLQLALFKIFGLNVFALAILKNSLIFLVYFSLYKAARRILKNDLTAVLSTISLLLIYNFSWIIHKDLTHSILMLALCAASVYLFAGIFSRPQIKYYLLLGVVMGLGILTKYNYILFILALFFAALTLANYRPAILNRKMFLGLLLCFAIITPHLIWAINHVTRVTTDVVDFNIDSKVIIPFKALYIIFTETLIFLLPLAIFYAIFFPQGFKRGADNGSTEPDIRRWLARFFIFSALLVLGIIFATHVQHIKVRWLQPFLFIVPLYFFTRLSTRPTPLRLNIFLGLVVFCAVSTLFSVPGRIFLASHCGKYVRLNYPYRQLAESIRRDGFSKGLILAENHVIGGDLKLYFKDSTVAVPDSRFLVDRQKIFDSVLIAWEDNGNGIPGALQAEVRRFGYNPDNFKIMHERQLFKYSRDTYYELDVAIGHRESGI